MHFIFLYVAGHVAAESRAAQGPREATGLAEDPAWQDRPHVDSSPHKLKVGGVFVL